MLRISLETGIEELEKRIEHTHQVIGTVFLDLGKHVFVMSFVTCLELAIVNTRISVKTKNLSFKSTHETRGNQKCLLSVFLFLR